MTEPSPAELAALRTKRQRYFVPYYRRIVDEHPEGIAAEQVKRLVAEQLLERFGIDISDPEQTGLNPSTNRSQAEQWANNLVSNRVLDSHMLVVRDTRATLYPGSADNSRPVPDPGVPLTPGQVHELERRTPQWTVTRQSTGSRTARRSVQLAEHVRRLSNHQCAVGKPTCITFVARDGRPYVEVHHMVPMALQQDISLNLDRTSNMVPLCATCHVCMHRGRCDVAEDVIVDALGWFLRTHGRSFQSANEDLELDTTASGLVAIYAAGAGDSLGGLE